MDHLGIVGSTAGPAFAVDMHGIVVAWNRAAEELFGRAAGRVLGQSCWDVVQGRDCYGNTYCELHCPLIEMALQRQAIHRCDLSFRDAKGETVQASTISFVISGNSPEEMVIAHILSPRPAVVHASDGPAGSTTGTTKQARLTAREIQVLRLMGRGAPTREIARELCISSGTVRNHSAKILRTLKAHNRLQAVATARALRLIP